MRKGGSKRQGNRPRVPRQMKSWARTSHLGPDPMTLTLYRKVLLLGGQGEWVARTLDPGFALNLVCCASSASHCPLGVSLSNSWTLEQSEELFQPSIAGATQAHRADSPGLPWRSAGGWVSSWQQPSGVRSFQLCLLCLMFSFALTGGLREEKEQSFTSFWGHFTQSRYSGQLTNPRSPDLQLEAFSFGKWRKC